MQPRGPATTAAAKKFDGDAHARCGGEGLKIKERGIRGAVSKLVCEVVNTLTSYAYSEI